VNRCFSAVSGFPSIAGNSMLTLTSILLFAHGLRNPLFTRWHQMKPLGVAPPAIPGVAGQRAPESHISSSSRGYKQHSLFRPQPRRATGAAVSGVRMVDCAARGRCVRLGATSQFGGGAIAGSDPGLLQLLLPLLRADFEMIELYVYWNEPRFLVHHLFAGAPVFPETTSLHAAAIGETTPCRIGSYRTSSGMPKPSSASQKCFHCGVTRRTIIFSPCHMEVVTVKSWCR
jgi:hypothetical protein